LIKIDFYSWSKKTFTGQQYFFIAFSFVNKSLLELTLQSYA